MAAYKEADVLELVKAITSCMEATNESEQLKSLAADWRQCICELYEMNNLNVPSKLRTWHLPKCVCPKMDNDELYARPYIIVTDGCPIHT